MSNKEKAALMPKLRFPEFEQSWEEIPLGELGQFFRGLTYGADDVASEGLLVLRSSNIQGGQLVLDSDLVFVTKRCPPEMCLKRGDIAICMSNGSKALVGKSGEFHNDYPGELTVGAFCSIFRPKKPFAKIAFSTPRYENFVATGIAGGNINNLKNSDLESFVFHVPPTNEEQQKIADCLSSLDELIAAQARKVEALKTHKKGLMQQLFPREGETQPRLRFPEFRDAGAWSKRKLSNFLTERSQFPENKVPLYSLTIEDGVTPKTERYERAFLVNDEAEAYKLVLPNDFAFNPMNLRFGAIGRHSGTEAVAVSKYYNIFYCDNSVDSRFCDIYFRSDAMVRFYDTMAIGSLIEKRRVHFSDFLKFNIRFPSSLEQQRIADCIASLDTLITATIQELEALKIHKKGLMQQLFPQGETLS
jgi:type I restriction enzyme S subunit